MDVDLVQAVASVGDEVRVRTNTGHEFNGRLVSLALTHLVVEELETGARHAILLTTLVAVSAGAAAAANGRAHAMPLLGVPVPTESEIGPGPGDAPHATATATATAPQVPLPSQPPLIVPSSANAIATLGQRPLSLPAFVSADDDGIINRPVHDRALARLRAQYEYADRIKELAVRFGRCARMAADVDTQCRIEPRSSVAHRLAGYFHFLADQPVAACHRFVRAASIANQSDPSLWLDTAVAALAAGETGTAQHALVQYFGSVSADADPDAWWTLVAVSDGSTAKHLLYLLRHGASPSPTTRAAVLDACRTLATSGADAGLLTVVEQLTRGGEAGAAHTLPPLTPLAQSPPPPPVNLRPDVADVRPTPSVTATPAQFAHVRRPRPPVPAPRVARTSKNPYDRAKTLEHRTKDLEAAKRAYREAIQQRVNTESAVKDLAWLTRRTDGPEAALRVLEEEYPGLVEPSPALDQILIDFYMGAGRFRDALELLEPLSRTGQRAGQRAVTLRRVCVARLSLGLDATAVARELVDLQPRSESAQRSYAVALLRRGAPGDVDGAAAVIEPLLAKGDHQAIEIAAELQRMRDGSGTDDLDRLVRDLWTVRSGATSTFSEYILANFGQSADGIRQQREFQGHDIRYFRMRAEEARRKRGRERSDSYLSAAKVDRELAHAGEDATRYFAFLCRGVSALGDIYLPTNAEVAREFYGEALAIADKLDEPATEQDFWNSLVRYVTSVFDGPQAVERVHDRGGNTAYSADQVSAIIADDVRSVSPGAVPQLFAAVDDLAAHTTFAAEAVVRAIHRDDELADRAREHLAEFIDRERGTSIERTIDAWRAAAMRRAAVRDELDQRVRLLRETQIAEVSLARAIAILEGVQNDSALELTIDREAVRKLLGNFRKLEEAVKEPSFEEQEFRYLQVRNAMADFADSVKAFPTRVTVGSLLPIATSIAELVEQTLERLYATREPDPRVSLALEEYTPDAHGRINVQVKVSNEPGCAPVETPEITVVGGLDSGVRVDAEARRSIATVRGGDASITLIPVILNEDLVASGAFSLQIGVTYGTRTGDREVGATLAVRLTREADFETIRPNPFKEGASGRPVSDPEMFFGRQELVNQIEALLVHAKEPGAGVAIYGQKRAGKSSIRLHLSRALHDSGRFLVADVENIGRFAPIRVDGQPSDDTLQILLWAILEKANQVVADRIAAGAAALCFLPSDVTRDSFLCSRAPVADFISYFERFNKRAAAEEDWRDRGFVVLLDEFQFVANWIRDGRVAPTFVQALKAILEQRLFHLVVVGVDAMQSFIDRYPNEFGVFAKRRVNYLERPFAFDLMDKPIRIGGPGGESRYRERAQEQIESLTGGNPFYIQRFCYELVEHMNSSKAPFVTKADVELVREKMLNEFGPSDFENLETSDGGAPNAVAAETARQVLAAVANGSPDGRATLDEIRSHCSVDDVEAILNDLEAREVVVHESGRYRILVRLYHEWLRRRTA